MILDGDSNSSRHRYQQPLNLKHSRSKKGPLAAAAVDRTHINEALDTSTVVLAEGEGSYSPHKSAIPRLRESSCSDQEIKKLKEAMFNEVHDRSMVEDPVAGGNQHHLEYEDYTPNQ